MRPDLGPLEHRRAAESEPDADDGAAAMESESHALLPRHARSSALDEEETGSGNVDDDGGTGREGVVLHGESPVVDSDLVVAKEESKGFGGLFTGSSYVTLCAAFSALGGLLFGYDQGVISIILVMPQFLSRFPSVGPSDPSAGFAKGLLTATIELGALIGALGAGELADAISRRHTIAAAVSVFALGSALQTGATTYAVLAAARFVGGVGIGGLSTVVPLYIAEISPQEVRGALLVLEELSIVTGIVVAFGISYASRYIAGEWAWRLPFLLQLAPGLLLGAGVWFLPPSPRWLVARRRDREALEVLARLRQRGKEDARVRKEWIEIRAEAELHRYLSIARHPHLQGTSLGNRVRLSLASWADCFKPGCWRRTHVGMGLMFFQQFVGINALIYYSPSLFETLGLDSEMQLVMSGVLNISQLFGVISSLWSMDRLGRRKLLLIGSLLMAIALIIISVLVSKYSYDWQSHQREGWVGAVFLLFYMISFGSTWGPVPWAMPSEIFPSSLRGKGVALCTASNWLNNFAVGLITPPLVQSTSVGAFALFATFCVFSFVWTYVFVPETKGLSLEQMDDVFMDRSVRQEAEERVAVARIPPVPEG